MDLMTDCMVLTKNVIQHKNLFIMLDYIFMNALHWAEKKLDTYGCGVNFDTNVNINVHIKNLEKNVKYIII
jgi:hypothetical protein